MPVPERFAICVPALSVTVSVPFRAPATVGVNVTLIVQFEFAASEVPQVLVWAKSPVVLTLMPVRLLD